MNKKHIYAISKSRTQINQILSTLCGSGSSSCDICILPPGSPQTVQQNPWRESRVAEGAIIGAILGGLLGAVIALIKSSGMFTVPGMIPMMAAGSGLGALSTWIAGSSAWKFARQAMLRGNEASGAIRPQNLIPEGNFLISIRTGDRKQQSRVKRVLSEEGIEQIAWH